MSKKQALTNLLALAEAGDENALSTAIRKMESAARDTGGRFPGFEMRKAYGGSLDAAKALHEAVLPDWSVDDLSQNGRGAGEPWGIRLAFWNGSNPGKNMQVWAGWGSDKTPDKKPARVWLIAILKALILEAST